MFLRLNHQSLDLYSLSKSLVLECYKMTNALPPEEKFAMVSQIRRAALSVHLNIAEGASRKSLNERKRFFEIARSSLVEIDSALDIAAALNYIAHLNLEAMEEKMIRCFKILTVLIRQ
jgi:four helix bundle protein